MAANNLVVLILGAGPKVGASVAERFLSNGYKVAVASRSGEGVKSIQGPLALKADFSNPASIPPIFDAVKTQFGSAPNIVIYNAAGLSQPLEKDATLTVPVEDVMKDLNINTVSPYVAAQQAVLGWATLPEGINKAFIYTGNALNVSTLPIAMFLNLSMGKSASASWFSLADMTYSAKGYRFFYADQRQPDGKSMLQGVDGPAHADFFQQLAKDGKNVPWQATFVKEKGYVKFYFDT